MARPNWPDIPPKRAIKVRFDLIILVPLYKTIFIVTYSLNEHYITAHIATVGAPKTRY